jgi:hypothetical protein
MGTAQGNSLFSCLYLKLANHHVPCFIYCFSFYKIEEQEGRTSSAWGGGAGKLAPVGEGRLRGKEDRRLNMVQTMYTHICKCKNDTC